MEKEDDIVSGNTTEAIDEESPVTPLQEVPPVQEEILPEPEVSSAPRNARERYLRRVNKAHLT